MNLETALTSLYDLKRDKVGEYERPHKPVLLLSILDLIEAGKVINNRIFFSDALREVFKEYFRVVAHGNDHPSIENPF